MKVSIKKSISLLLAVIMIIATVPMINASAKTSGKLTYEVKNGEVTITECAESASGKLTIPSKIDGYPVTKIDDTAFWGCNKLTSVTIPDSVTSIGYQAFLDCNSLTNINVSKNNKYYSSKDGVLLNKNGTVLIQYPAGKASTAYTIPNSVATIGSYAFYSCTGLKSVTIPDSVTSIGEGAFCICSSLKSIAIPDNVTSIGDAAFSDCSNLKSITISDSVTSIGKFAFQNTAYYDNSSNWKNDVLYIGNHLIKATDSIKGSYKIKSGTKCIADYAFKDCDSLTSITIPDSVTSIGVQAFKFCESLANIKIGNDVTRIGEEAFYETAYYNDSSNIYNGALYLENHLLELEYFYKGSYKIKSGTKCIADYAFIGCGSKLTSVTIPGSVKYIGVKAIGYDGETYGPISGFTINGHKGSAAETYAKENNFKFVAHKNNYTSKVTTKATTSKNGKITYTCDCGYSYTKSIPKIKSVTLSNDTFTYNGKVKQPTVTVKDSKGNKLTKGTDYTVKYSSGRKNVGKYTVTVTFKGNYSGTKKLTFKIKPKGTSISKLTAGTKKFTVDIKKQATQTTGYQVQYSKNSSMKSATTKTYASTSKTSRTISGLKSATKYYVRVRTYKNVKINGKTYKYFSTWSSIKSVKTK